MPRPRRGLINLQPIRVHVRALRLQPGDALFVGIDEKEFPQEKLRNVAKYFEALQRKLKIDVCIHAKSMDFQVLRKEDGDKTVAQFSDLNVRPDPERIKAHNQAKKNWNARRANEAAGVKSPHTRVPDQDDEDIGPIPESLEEVMEEAMAEHENKS